jgi:hypothetical protein
MRWLEPNFIPLIFSSYHGLVPWTPGLALGLLMLPIAMARRRSLRGWPSALPVAFTVGTGLAIYVSACPEDWWGGASFSARRLTSLTAPAAVGLGLLLWRLSARMKRLVAGLVGSWAVVAVSAHLSRFEDLGLLLVGRPGPFQPPGIAAVAPPAWASAWGALHFAVPGFSLSDAPRWWDRVVGILIVVGVVVSLRLTWAMLQGRPRLQTAVALLAVIYVLSWSVFLTLCPSNTRWNVTWREFLERPLDPSRSRLLSPDMGVARDVVTAFRAAREHDTASLEAAIARLREAGLDVTEADVRRAARDPRTP